MTTQQIRELQYFSSDESDYQSSPIRTSVSTPPRSILVNEPMDTNQLAGPSTYKSPDQSSIPKNHLPSISTQHQITSKRKNVPNSPITETVKPFRDHRDTMLLSKSKNAAPRIKNRDNEIKASLQNLAINTPRSKPSYLQPSPISPLTIQKTKVDLGTSQPNPIPAARHHFSPTVLPRFVRSPIIKKELSSLENRQNMPPKSRLPDLVSKQPVHASKIPCSPRIAPKQEVLSDKVCPVPSIAPVRGRIHQSPSIPMPQIKRQLPANSHPPTSTTPNQFKAYQHPNSSGSQSNNRPLPNIPQAIPLKPSTVQKTPKKPPSNPIMSVNGLGSRVIENERYTALRIIGKGGTGTVASVFNETGELFALKSVPFKNDPELRIGILNEIEIMRKLKESEWIIRIINSEITSRYAFIVMELGEINFQALIRNQDSNVLDLDFIRLYWRHMLSGVQFIHDNNIVHTDLKPENFVLMKGKLKLIDFGIARAIPKDQTSVIIGDEIGTLEYMAPEAIHGENRPRPTQNGPAKIQLRPSCDIWSLGCILYFMTYRYTPYSSLNRGAQILCLRSDDPAGCIVTPGSLVKNGQLIYRVSDPLIRVIWGCLKNNPAERLTTRQLLELSIPLT